VEQPSPLAVAPILSPHNGQQEIRPIEYVEVQIHASDLHSFIKRVLGNIPIPIAIYVAATLLSLTRALWWSIAHNDISGGFTMGAYVWGIVIFPTGYWHWSLHGRSTHEGDDDNELRSLSWEY
jgi:hypothetical protein